AVALYLYGLNLFAKREVDLSDLDMDFSYEKFIYFSFIWLFIAELAWSGFAVYEALSGTTVPHALVGSYRHAITVGFISMMIFGYASRIFPVFTGEELRFPKATNATFWLVAAGNTMRVLFQPIAVFTGKGVFFALMASSSVLEVAGLALFSVNIWLTVQKAQHAMLETPAAS
ncbi:MAG: NnrS family protein, partial [Syntrophothermus sp.]